MKRLWLALSALLTLASGLAFAQGGQGGQYGGDGGQYGGGGCPLTGCAFTGPVTLPSGSTLAGWVPSFVLSDASAGPVSAGSGYALGDVLTLNDGCSIHAVVTVNLVASGGVSKIVTVNRGSCATIPNNPISVLSSVTSSGSAGAGSGATFNLSYGPLAASINWGTLNSNGGNLFLGGETPANYFGSESVFVGDRASGRIRSGDFISSFGHDACGIGNGVDIFNATGMLCFGTDAGRNIVNGVARDTILGVGSCENLSSTDNVCVGNGIGNAMVAALQNVVISGGASLVSGQANLIAGFGSDVTGGAVGSAIALGQNAKTPGGSVVIGAGAGNANMTGGTLMVLGPGVGSAGGCGAAQRVLLIGVTSDTDCSSSGEFFTIHLGNSGADIIKVTGTNAPSTSVMTIAGLTTFGGQITLASSTTGAAAQTFTNSPCATTTTERWVPVSITGQTGTWYVPACH